MALVRCLVSSGVSPANAGEMAAVVDLGLSFLANFAGLVEEEGGDMEGNGAMLGGEEIRARVQYEREVMLALFEVNPRLPR